MDTRRKLPILDNGTRFDRRTILMLTGATLLAACGGGGGTDAGDAGGDDAGDAMGPDGADGDVDAMTSCMGNDVGPVEMFAPDTWTLITSPRVIIGRDAAGIFAYGANCTHFGVPLPAPTDGVSVCPVAMGGHGSRFDGDGRFIAGSGPATRDLPNYRVSICDGRVHVNFSEMVPIGTRTPVA